MGDIKKILGFKKLNSSPLFCNDLRVENAESIHLHWRDLRILMSQSQFSTLHNGVTEAVINWDGALSNEDLVLSHTNLPDKIIFKDEAKVEELRDGNIHFHWRDLRLELTPEDFLSLCELIISSKNSYGGVE